METYVVGVDGGTTKTVALVADGYGQIVGAARGAGSNWTGTDVEIPMAVVIAMVEEALQRAGLGGQYVSTGVFCLAGADWPDDHERRQIVLEDARIVRQVVVKNDTFGGLRAGTRRPYGVVIAAGTGCNAAAIAPDGREWHFGYYEDYGGARTIVEEAVRAVLRVEDGRGQPTLLSDVVLGRLEYANPEAMLRAMVAGEFPRKRALGLCPFVFEVAAAGDRVAIEIIVKQGVALAEYATTLIRRFDMQDLAFDVVLSGSVFKGQGPWLNDTITQKVHQVAPRARIVRAEFEPVVGAVLLAYDAAGVAVTDQMYERLAETAPGGGFFSTLSSA
jgi:N-acetylglucosamine kinase-like BadF-type ATPase